MKKCKFISLVLFLILFLCACTVASKKKQHIAAEKAWKKYISGKFLTDKEQKALRYGQE